MAQWGIIGTGRIARKLAQALVASAGERVVAAGHGAAGLPAMPLAETLDNAATLDALLRSAREGRPVEVANPGSTPTP